MKCLECGQDIKNNIALGLHVKKHNMTSKEYYDKYMRKSNEGICPTCKKETPWQSFDRGYLKHCSYKCTQNDPKVIKKREDHFMSKYGVKNPYQAEEVKQKIKESNLANYGVEYNLQRKETIQQAKQTKLERYGDQNYNNVTKAKTTCLDKYGVDSYSKTDKFKSTIRAQVDFYAIAKKGLVTHNIKVDKQCKLGYITIQDAFIKYGQSWYKNKIVPILYKYHTGFISLADEQIIKSYYENNNGHSSQEENKLLELLHKYYSGTIIHGEHKIIAPLELDFYIPELNIAIEYNGIYWHSAKFKNNDYHYNKSMSCFNKGIRLIHFYEFEDWTYIEQFIKDLFNNTEQITHNFDKFSPLQFDYSTIEFSGPQLLECNIFGSGTFNLK